MKNSQKEKITLHQKMQVKIVHSDDKKWIVSYFYPSQDGSFEEGHLWEDIILGKKNRSQL